MRVLFLAPRFHSNQSDLVRKLHDEGHEVLFLVVASTKSEDHRVVKPHVLSRTPLGDFLNRRYNPEGDGARYASLAMPSPREVWRVLSDFNPDVAIVRGFAGSFVAWTLAWLWAHRRPVILYTQGPKHRHATPRAKQALTQRLLRGVTRGWFTPVERSVLTTAPARHDTGACFIPFFKFPEKRAFNRAYASPPRFIAIAKFVPRKNLRALIDAFVQVAASGESTLTIIGENTLDLHARVLAELRSAVPPAMVRRVRFMENLAFDEVQEQYLQHDVFVLPSFAEPASVSQVEAMAHGLAVVCNRDNGTAHYVIDGETGLLVSGDVASLATALAAYLADPALAGVHGRAGLTRLSSDYSVDRGYRALLEMCEQSLMTR